MSELAGEEDSEEEFPEDLLNEHELDESKSGSSW